MTSVWDDPEIQVAGDYVKFEAVGDKVVGDVIAVSKHTFPDGKTAAKVVIRDDDGTDRTLTAGQMKLAEKLIELRPAAGDRISIEFTSIEKRPGGKTMKHFDVKHTAGGAKGTVAVEVDGAEEPF